MLSVPPTSSSGSRSIVWEPLPRAGGGAGGGRDPAGGVGPAPSGRGRCRAASGHLSRRPSPRLLWEGCAPGWRGAWQRLPGGPAARGSACCWPSPWTSGEVSGRGGTGRGVAGPQPRPGTRGCSDETQAGSPAACPEGWQDLTPGSCPQPSVPICFLHLAPLGKSFLTQSKSVPGLSSPTPTATRSVPSASFPPSQGI